MELLLAHNPVLIAIGIGMLPSVIWLTFWLYLARDRREPFLLMTMCFILGGLSVFAATFIQHALTPLVTSVTHRVIIWAAIEECLKFLVFYGVAYKSAYDNEALDPAMYLIVVALGFAAIENIFYVLKPAATLNITASLLTGGLRFFGSTLLHVIASCFIGIMITLSPRRRRTTAMFVGLAGAIFLHSTFNFFVLKNTSTGVIQVYGFLWMSALLTHLILEKFRRYPPRALARV
ncbi:MAG TPA: PrsW family glutamic-type intramembrane protease [Candidatus Paceibacterota bacterium]|nr:PrsW family glutamic-type intramembrane protease [Candidatus Paceibacterota bacterium]